MSKIFLKWFGGMIPRLGEQHLKTQRIQQTGFFASPGAIPTPDVVEHGKWATDATNTDLYSGELRPLKEPALAHVFSQPGDGTFITPPPTDPGQPTEPPNPWCPPDELCVSPCYALPEYCLEPPTNCVGVVIDATTGTQVAAVGDQITHSITTNVGASAPFFYAWYRNGIFITGATSNEYTMTVRRQDFGARYTCFVQNPCGEQMSADMLITEA